MQRGRIIYLKRQKQISLREGKNMMNISRITSVIRTYMNLNLLHKYKHTRWQQFAHNHFLGAKCFVFCLEICWRWLKVERKTQRKISVLISEFVGYTHNDRCGTGMMKIQYYRSRNNENAMIVYRCTDCIWWNKLAAFNMGAQLFMGQIELMFFYVQVSFYRQWITKGSLQ